MFKMRVISMLYDIGQVAEKLKVSKMTIYKKIKLNDFKDKITKKAGKIFIDDSLFSAISESIRRKDDSIDEEVAVDDISGDLINTLHEQVKFLKQQILTKDGQIETQSELMKNMQILNLRQLMPQQDIKALEAHFQDLDTKLEEVNEKMKERKQDQEPKGFLSKLFNKK